MNSSKEEFIQARKLIYEEVKKELLGPGSEDIAQDIEHEIITDEPISRYSLGILFPKDDKYVQDVDSDIDIETKEDSIDVQSFNYKNIKLKNYNVHNKNEAEDFNEKIGMTNELKPSSIGITFFAKGKIDELKIRVNAAKYRKSKLNDCCVKYEGQDYFKENDLSDYVYRDGKYLKLKKSLDNKIIKMYLNSEDERGEYINFKNTIYALSRQNNRGFVREPLSLKDVIKIKLSGKYTCFDLENKPNSEVNYKLQMSIFKREYKNDISSYTVVLSNNEVYNSYGRDEKSVFQPEISISTEDNPGLVFVENRNNDFINIKLELDDEEKSLELLYRDKKNYAIGHGVSTMQYVDKYTGLGKLKTSFVPYYEVKGIDFELEGITPEILSMKNLSDYSTLDDDTIINNLKIIANSYAKWINSLEMEAENFEGIFKETAIKHINECKLCCERINRGINVLQNNKNAFLAFKLMNRALFMQRVQSKAVEVYKERYPSGSENLDYKNPPFVEIDFKNESYKSGVWRAFQIAYILMCLESIVDPNCKDRDIVDLIWVPTGGGKTEAYLGLTAFVIFLRRIENNKDNGTAVIMRYTLRLLATQQFTRASILICACELIRKENEKLLGKDRITIGLWIGGTQTPNTKAQAIQKCKELKESFIGYKENAFQVLKCPWCGTKLEKTKVNGKIKGSWGYDFNTIDHRIFCTEEECPFYEDEETLPIEVVDEFIYKNPPTLLFGTVDKFASITWKGEARNLFALDKDNSNKSPELIIQDELHLISGPLGSIVGEYETVVDLLCREKGIRPKIIASTATIRRAKEQCNQLYARDVKQFPPSGLKESDSFFTKEDKNKFGRVYVGIMPSGKTLTTVQVRLMSALTNRVNMLDINPDIKSEYYTLVGYFNTLKELGMTRSLINADIQQNIDIVTKRLLRKKYPRGLYNIAELTSRRSSSDINNTLKNLEIGLNDIDKDNKIYPIDVLLSSNMISVGVDISRLNLMMILQQPKLTSEYIQATSRVGRRNPGIVFTLYNPARSRDRSHYENFYDYHQSFYKYVEPTSVTSFSEPARDRMLQSVFIALVRHIVGLNDNSSAVCFNSNEDKVIEQINHILDRIKNILIREEEDCNKIDTEIEDVKKYLQKIEDIWEVKIEQNDDLYYDSQKKPSLLKRFSNNNHNSSNMDINILTSMRNVDSQAKVDIIVFEED